MAFSVDDLVAMNRVTSVAASIDGSWFAVEVQHLDDAGAKYVSAIWRVSAQGEAHPLLKGPASYKQPCFRCDGALGFLSDRSEDADAQAVPDDDARFQVWVLAAEGGDPLCITDEPLGVQAVRFARAADRMVVVAPVLPAVAHADQRGVADERKKHGPSALHYTSGPVRHWDHWIQPAAPHFVAYDGSGGQRRDLTPEADREHREGSWDLSDDGSMLVVSAARPSRHRVDEVRLVAIDVATGIHTVLFDRPDEVAANPKISPDGTRVLASHHGWTPGQAFRLGRLVLGSSDGTSREIAPDWDRWSAPVGWSGDGRQIVVLADDEGIQRLFAVGVESHEVVALTDRANGSVDGVVRGSDGWVGIWHGLQSAPEAFAVSDAGHARALTTLAGVTGLEALASVDERTVAGAGETPVQYWLMIPEGATGPCPTVVWIHGGPMSAWNDQWHWRWNANVALAAGFAIALPNPRGSTGFGQRFIDGVWGNRYGAECYEDVMAVVEAVAADPRVDGQRMAAMGGSFGGYMTNWIGGNTERFRCLVTHASLYDFPRFYGVTDHPPFWSLKMGCTPYGDPEAFDRYSPHSRVTHWKTPTLVIHGEKDYRVPIGEGIALFEALQANDVPSELLVFPDENHWILKPRNIKAWYGAVLEYLGRHLGAG